MEMIRMKILVAMSGGVDSSVAALKLKSEGHDLIGATIQTWPKEECDAEGEKLCCSESAVRYARSVAEDLDIPYHVIDLSREFAEIVKDYFAEEYSRGRTPNPCIYCNSRIKFGLLLKKARQMGAEKIATGHYARILKGPGGCMLSEARDKWRDQSYFLYDISQKELSSVLFPLGEMAREEVKEMAVGRNFMSAWRKSSQDVCFATAQSDYRDYLSKLGIEAFKEGDILDTSGKVIGRHKGVAAYTVGQRRGLGLAMPQPVYVLKIDADNNTITVGEKEHAMNSRIRVAGFNWLIMEKLKGKMRFQTKIRYNSKKEAASVIPWGDDEAVVEFDRPQFAPTPGQAAVFYDDEVVAGGGWIEEALM
ncbi:MAG: tRNA 2-thiouridine(34) synthase MnmA [Candidatus Omnitrophica bacterium]|nr:tRNA 2-thiouridine(34) synthase MnmA [Candidatus Omnitrophota bacterium]